MKSCDVDESMLVSWGEGRSKGEIEERGVMSPYFISIISKAPGCATFGAGLISKLPLFGFSSHKLRSTNLHLGCLWSYFHYSKDIHLIIRKEATVARRRFYCQHTRRKQLPRMPSPYFP